MSPICTGLPALWEKYNISTNSPASPMIVQLQGCRKHGCHGWLGTHKKNQNTLIEQSVTIQS